ncbi:MAG: cyclophilin family peptidyl-prolyl cis-trans isomerase [Candidatus Paceibacteria bacterium]|jgi:cyclophilin family peptidyl-prolyl cis-trans isomerase
MSKVQKMVIVLLLASVVVGIMYFFKMSKNTEFEINVNNKNEETTNMDDSNVEGENVGNMAGPQQPQSQQPQGQQPQGEQLQGLATLKTNAGDITIQLFPQAVPNTVNNFVKLASEGFYNGTKFHRVIKDFMIQGGDPLSKDDSAKARWGTGGPGYQFADEFHKDLSNIPGTISMANSGPDTNGSQFFINVGENTFLDGKHSVFGQVTEGADIVMGISGTETGPNDVPATPIVINSIEIK